jgi:RHS repeat-associated protein
VPNGEPGLDHTWFRKNENKAGRWTSPDPYNGSATIGDPQSFNRYSYVTNQPTNFVDPSGLQFCYLTVWEGGGRLTVRQGRIELMDQAATLPTAAAAGGAATTMHDNSIGLKSIMGYEGMWLRSE